MVNSLNCHKSLTKWPNELSIGNFWSVITFFFLYYFDYFNDPLYSNTYLFLLKKPNLKNVSGPSLAPNNFQSSEPTLNLLNFQVFSQTGLKLFNNYLPYAKNLSINSQADLFILWSQKKLQKNENKRPCLRPYLLN